MHTHTHTHTERDKHCGLLNILFLEMSFKKSFSFINIWLHKFQLAYCSCSVRKNVYQREILNSKHLFLENNVSFKILTGYYIICFWIILSINNNNLYYKMIIFKKKYFGYLNNIPFKGRWSTINIWPFYRSFPCEISYIIRKKKMCDRLSKRTQL